MAIRCRIELFGGLCVQVGEQRHTRFRTRKTAELLAYLAYFHNHAQPREVLLKLLGRESDVDPGKHNLSMALSALRQERETNELSLFLADRHSIGLNSAVVTTDVADFETALSL